MVEEKRQSMTIRLTVERYEWLRRQAYERRIPMQQIIDEAIDRLRQAPDWANTTDERANG